MPTAHFQTFEGGFISSAVVSPPPPQKINKIQMVRHGFELEFYSG